MGPLTTMYRVWGLEMAYAKDFVRLTFLVPFDGSEELGSTHLDISTLGAGSFDALTLMAGLTTTVLNDIRDEFLTTGAISEWRFQYGVGAVQVKAAAIGTDGSYIADPKLSAAQAPAAFASSLWPPQSTPVVSLWDGISLGKGHRGRCYVPYVQPTSPGNLIGRINTSSRDALANRWSALIQEVNDVVDGIVAGSGVVIMGQTGAGTVAPVTYVRVGDILDTQRRRRNGLAENYIQVTV